MAQDKYSGGRAAIWGHETAQRIATAIGATGMGKTSNECRHEGQRAVIKCAAADTDSVGVTYQMLSRLDRIIAAFQLEDGSFELWALTPRQFEEGMRDSAGSGKGKTGLVRRDYFKNSGRSLGR